MATAAARPTTAGPTGGCCCGARHLNDKQFASAGRFDEWVESWRQAMQHNDDFAGAFAAADGQTAPPLNQPPTR